MKSNRNTIKLERLSYGGARQKKIDEKFISRTAVFVTQRILSKALLSLSKMSVRKRQQSIRIRFMKIITDAGISNWPTQKETAKKDCISSGDKKKNILRSQ